MNLLDFFFIISGTLLFFLSLDIAKKQRFNALHFLVFLCVWWGLLVFTFFPQILNYVGNIFGIARGADVLVYISIIFLIYFSLLLLSKHLETKEGITRLIRELSLSNSVKKSMSDELIFIVRCYNESQSIGWVVRSLQEAWYHSILIVDDGSTDKSNNIFSSFSDSVVVLRHSINRWAGAALETWFEYLRRYATCSYVVCFDADGQHDIKDLPKFLKAFEQDKNLEVVIGSRFLSEGWAKNIPFSRKLTLLWGKIFTFLVSRINLSDAHNGYRVFRYSVLEKLSLTIDGMGYASELTEQIARNNIKYREVPVNILYSDYSLGKWQKSSNAFWIVLRFIWTKFFR